MAHLGAVDMVIAGTTAVLLETANWIDRCPDANAQTSALHAHLVVEQTATKVVARADLRRLMHPPGHFGRCEARTGQAHVSDRHGNTAGSEHRPH